MSTFEKKFKNNLRNSTRRPALPKVSTKEIFGKGMKELQPALASKDRLDFPGEPPPTLTANKPEWYCYWALNRLGKQQGIDFEFQSNYFGGRLGYGGMVADFVMLNPPGIAININGFHWHYGMAGDRRIRDEQQRIQLSGMGILLIFIDEEDILKDPKYYVSEALKGVDHSHVERGF